MLLYRYCDKYHHQFGSFYLEDCKISRPLMSLTFLMVSVTIASLRKSLNCFIQHLTEHWWWTHSWCASKAQLRVDQSVIKELEVNGESTIMKMAPIPPYLVYDGFEEDLEANMVHERVLDCQHDSPMWSNALEFLSACKIGQWRMADIKPFLPAEQFHRMLPREARLWAATRMEKILPELSFTPAPVTPARGPPTGGLQYRPHGGIVGGKF